MLAIKGNTHPFYITDATCTYFVRLLRLSSTSDHNVQVRFMVELTFMPPGQGPEKTLLPNTDILLRGLWTPYSSQIFLRETVVE